MSITYLKDSLDRSMVNKAKSCLAVTPYKMVYSRGRMKKVKGEDIVLYTETETTITVPYAFGTILFSSGVKEKYTVVDLRMNTELLPRQISCYEEAMRYLKSKGTITLGLYTGFGKTILSLYIAFKLELPILILCVGNVLTKSWKQTLLQFTNSSFWVVGEETPEAANVVICPMSRFSLIPNDYLKVFGTLIVDEIHEMCTQTRAPNMLKVTPRYIIACTATPERSDDMDVIHRSICGNHLITRPDARPLRIYKLDTGIDPGVPGTKWEKMLTSLYTNHLRNSYVVRLVKANQHKKILILTWRVSHGKKLKSLIEKEKISVDEIMESKTDYKDSKVLIGTLSKIGTGFDEKTVCSDFGGKRIDLTIFLSTTKSKTLLIQALGRGRRSEDPSVVYFVDESKTIQSHWKIARSSFPKAEYYNLTLAMIDSPLP